MKKLALMLCLLGSTGLAHAEAKYLQSESLCGPTDKIQEFLTQTKEMPFAGGSGGIQLSKDRVAEGEWQIHVNPQTKTFSIVINFEQDGYGCLIGAGLDFHPLKSGTNL